MKVLDKGYVTTIDTMGSDLTVVNSVESHAQWEIQQYAAAVAAEVEKAFPITYTSWSKYRV